MKPIKFAIFIFMAIVAVGCGTLKKGSSSAVVQETADSTFVEGEDLLREVAISAQMEQIAREWTIKTVNGKKINTTERPFIIFDFAENRFYGNNGCNVINGAFSCNGSNITFDNIISTMMFCHSETSEQTIMKALNDVVSIKMYEKNEIKYLHMLDGKGHVLITLKEQNLDFLNGAWTVEKINDKTIKDENVKLVIDIDQLTLHGNSGCNIVNGTIYVDYSKDWGVQFQQLISSMKMCENMKTETELLIALESVETCKPINGSEIALYDNKGNCVAVLKKLNLEKK